MKRKFTLALTTLLLLIFIYPPLVAVGQTRTTQTAFYGFETGDSGWTATSFVTTNTAITAHGGYKYGATNGGSTANVQYNTQVANPISLTCYYSKTSDNTNAGSHYEIQVSTNNSTWTKVAEGLGMNQVTKGTWYELTADLSSYSNVYVRVYYTGTSAVRALDDITLTYDDGQTPSTDPEISFTPTSITLDEVLVGNEVSTTFSVSQANLTSGITLSVDNGNLSPSSIEQGAAATTVTWTYTPTTAGAISATVTATSGETTETLAISGTAIAPVEGYDVDFEYATNMYPNWTFNNMESYQTGSITAHGGTYYGTTGGKATASITTTEVVANPGTLTCYVSKQSGNTTSSTWYIQVSEDEGSTWTNVENHSATSMSQGEWVEFSADLTDYTDVYVRVYYSGSIAIRNIDDLTLTTVTPSPAVATTTTINVPAAFNTDLHQGTTAGTLTATVTAGGNTISGAIVTWTSSNPDAATIDANGAVTLVAVGATTITASYAGVVDVYKPSSATREFTVVNLVPTLTVDPTTASLFTYNLGSGPSEEQVFEVTGANLTSNDIIATITAGDSYFEVTDDETYSNTVTIASGDMISIRMKAGLNQSSYEGTLTLSTEGATNVTMALSGTVKGPLYNIALDDQIEGGTIEADKAQADEGTVVTLTAHPANGYVFTSWSVKDAGQNPITVTNDKFTMPASNVTVSASFRQADIYQKYTGTMVDGYYVIGYISANGQTKNTIGTYDQSNTRFSPTDMSPVNDQLIDPTQVWHIESSGDYWTIYNVTDGKYLTGTGVASHVGYETVPSPESKKFWTITVDADGLYTIKNKYNEDQNITNNFFRYGGTYWACYSSGRGSFLYKKVVNSTMTVATVSDGTITATPTGGSTIAEGGTTTVSGGTTVILNATGEDTYVLGAWDVYKTGESTTKVTVTTNSFVMPDFAVTVSASFRQPTTFTVEYSINGEIDDDLTETDIPEGDAITLPTSDDVDAPDGYTFVGWTEDESSAVLISGDTYTPTDNTTLYLVFVKSGQTPGYNKVTSLNNITSGTYIIVNDKYCLPSVTTNTSPAKNDTYKLTNNALVSNYSSVPANTEWIFTGTYSAMTIKNADGKYLYVTSANNQNIRVNDGSDTWAFETNGSGFAMKDANYSRYCATYSSGNDWRSYNSANHGNYGDGGILYLFKKTPVYTRVYNATTTTMANIPATSIVTVPNGVTLTLTGTNQGNETNLIIEDGGQLITSSSNVQTTVQKNIAAWSTDPVGGWYFIASPISTAVRPEDAGLLTDALGGKPTYDLYYLDNTTWKNYRQTPFNLNNGQGYLYADSTQQTLAFTGTIKPYNTTNNTVTLTKTGWNLIGNPFTCAVTVDKDFNEVNNGSTVTNKTAGSTINPCAGIAVNGSEGEVVTFTKPTSNAPIPNNLSLVLAQQIVNRGESSSQTLDNAIVSFNEGNQLEKFYFGTQNANLYIPQGAEEYAIVNAQAQGEMPVSFRANENGQYTLTVNPEGVEMNYLHLIDNMTGTDVDLLATPSYTFNAKKNDFENRFKLVFAANNGTTNSAADPTFAFFSNGNLIINNAGEATLQIIDITGRVLSSETINGGTSINASGLTAGVYVLRLVNGKDVKTQKIVVE